MTCILYLQQPNMFSSLFTVLRRVFLRKQLVARRKLRRADVDQAGRQVGHVRVSVHWRRIDILGSQWLLFDREPHETPKRQRGRAQVFRVWNPTEVRNRLANRQLLPGTGRLDYRERSPGTEDLLISLLTYVQFRVKVVINIVLKKKKL